MGDGASSPHRAAPELILAEKKRWRHLLSLDLPATRRLPHDTVGYIESFYDFEFRAFARDGERGVRSNGRRKDGIDTAIDLLDSSSVVGSRNNDLLQRVLVNDGVSPGSRGYVTQS